MTRIEKKPYACCHVHGVGVNHCIVRLFYSEHDPSSPAFTDEAEMLDQVEIPQFVLADKRRIAAKSRAFWHLAH